MNYTFFTSYRSEETQVEVTLATSAHPLCSINYFCCSMVRNHSWYFLNNKMDKSSKNVLSLIFKLIRFERNSALMAIALDAVLKSWQINYFICGSLLKRIWVALNRSMIISSSWWITSNFINNIIFYLYFYYCFLLVTKLSYLNHMKYEFCLIFYKVSYFLKVSQLSKLENFAQQFVEPIFIRFQLIVKQEFRSLS